MRTLFVLSASQEEALQDIHDGVPRVRGSRSTRASLLRRGLVEFSDAKHCYTVTDLGMSQLRCQWARKTR